VANKCPSVAGYFDGHGEALKQYIRHLPMQHVQGYTGSHWTLPSSNYLLCIASAAAGATAKKEDAKCVHFFADHFDGHHGAPLLYRAHRSMEEVCGFHKNH